MENSILRRAGPLMLARLAVAAVSLAIPLVLARVLVPASYGTFKQAWLLCNTLYNGLPMGLTPSLLYFLPREPARRGVFVAHTLLATTLMGVLAACGLLLLGPRIAAAFHNPELGSVMPLVAAFTACWLAGTSLDIVYMGQGRIAAAAGIRVAVETLHAACIVGFTLATRSVRGALAGIAVAQAARALACWIVLTREHGLRVSVPDLRRQIAYALPFGLAFLVIIPQQQFHSYLVSATVSAAAFAVYSVGCFQIPIVDLLYTPISDVLQLGIAEHERRGDAGAAQRLFHEAVARLAFVFLPTMALLSICAPVLIGLLFTDRYLGAVPIFRVAILLVPLAALPLDGLMRARAQNRFVLGISLVKLALTIPLVTLGLRAFGTIGAIGGWIAAEALSRAVVLLRAARLFGVGPRGVLPFRQLGFQALAAAAASPIAAVVLRLAHGPALVRLCASGVSFSLAYLGTLRALGQLPPLRTWIPRRAAQPQPASSIAA